MLPLILPYRIILVPYPVTLLFISFYCTMLLTYSITLPYHFILSYYPILVYNLTLILSPIPRPILFSILFSILVYYPLLYYYAIISYSYMPPPARLLFLCRPPILFYCNPRPTLSCGVMLSHCPATISFHTILCLHGWGLAT